MSANRRERRKLLRQYGLLDVVKKSSVGSRIEEGQNTHRLNLQRIKNDQLKKERERSGEINQSDDVNFYHDSKDGYDSFTSLLASKDWGNLELDDNDAE